MTDAKLEAAVAKALREANDNECGRDYEAEARAVIPIVANEMLVRAAEAAMLRGVRAGNWPLIADEFARAIRALPLPCDPRSPRTTGDKR